MRRGEQAAMAARTSAPGLAWALWLALALAWCLCALAPARAATVAIDAHSSGTSLNPQLDLYIDRSDKMTLAQVVAAHGFEPSRGNTGLGLLGHPVWLRVTLARAPDAPARWWLELLPTAVDDLSFYAPDGKGGYSVVRAGEHYPFAERGQSFRKFIYPVELPADAEATYYFRFQDTNAVVFPLRIWQMDDWAGRRMLDYLLLGCCMGVMAGLACYNLLLFVRMRDPLFLLYFVQVLSFLLFIASLTGLGSQLLWPGWGYRIANMNQMIAAITATTVTLFGLMLVRGGKVGRWFDWIMGAAVLLYASAVPAAAFGAWEYAAVIITRPPMLFIPILLAVVVYRAATGFRPAFYYLVGYGPVLYGLMLMLQVGTGELPATLFNQTFYIVAGAWEAVLFSQALAVRFSLLREEKERIQARIVDEQRSRLEDARRHTAELEQKVHERTAQLEDANQAKSMFLANMSHEIRNPMNAVIGFSRLGLRSALDGSTRSYLQKILGAAENLLGILNDVLDFSKIEAGKLTLETAPFDLDHILDQLCDLIVLRTDAKGVESVVRVGPGVPHRLMGDSLRLGQVLSNLAGNAAKFTEQGEVVVAIELVEQRGDKVLLEFSVRDTGIGMTPDQLESLFQSFTQADASTTRKYGGTGLGLTISKQLVELMGGQIGVVSWPGLGSRFSFRIELGVAPVLHPRVRTPLPAQRVLVVDDNAQVREALAELLTELGQHAATAADGQSGLKLLERASLGDEPYDLALIDWRMPDWDGIETARRLRAEPRLKGLRIVLMVSAYGREEAVKLGAKNYVDSFLSKPASASLLYHCLGHLNEGHPARHLQAAPSHGRDLGLAGARILVAEDSALNREVAVGLLANNGIEVDLAENGQQAVDMVAAGDYDLVFMDIQMPVMDGLAAARAIRALPGKADLPIVAMTAHGMSGDHAASLAAGMNDHITKPVHPDSLFGALDTWVDRMRLDGRFAAALDVAPDVADDSPAPASAPAAELPACEVLDLAAARAMLGDSDELLLSSLQIFVDENGGAARAAGAALAARQFASVAAIAHSVRSAAGYLCAEALSTSAATLEELARQPRVDPEVLAAQVLHFQTDLLDAIAAVTALLPEMQK